MIVNLQRGNQLGHREEALVSEKDMLLKQMEFRDQFIEVQRLQHNEMVYAAFCLVCGGKPFVQYQSWLNPSNP